MSTTMEFASNCNAHHFVPDQRTAQSAPPPASLALRARRRLLPRRAARRPESAGAGRADRAARLGGTAFPSVCRSTRSTTHCKRRTHSNCSLIRSIQTHKYTQSCIGHQIGYFHLLVSILSLIYSNLL